MRYVQLTSQQQQQRIQLYKTSHDHHDHRRAQALLRSHRNYTIPDLADLFVVDRGTVIRWMDRWQEWLTKTESPLTLQDQARAERPSSLASDQKKA